MEMYAFIARVAYRNPETAAHRRGIYLSPTSAWAGRDACRCALAPGVAILAGENLGHALLGVVYFAHQL